MRKSRLGFYGLVVIALLHTSCFRMTTIESSGSGVGNAPGAISNQSLVDPLEAGQASNSTPFNLYQNSNQVGGQLGDFISSDSSGFSQWGRIYGAQTSFAPYLCRNGYLSAFRSCLDGGAPGKCIGAIEKTASCMSYGIERERFSGWTAWSPASSACNSNGKKFWNRTCINIASSTVGDTSTPLCYGPSQAEFLCTVDPNSAALSPGLKFKKNGPCVPYNPQTHQYTEYKIGCGGVHLYYSGSMTTQTDCYYPAGAASGSTPVCTGPQSQAGCFVPGTTCTSPARASEILQPGTIFTTAEGGTCGIAINPTTATNPLTAWEEGYTPEISASSQLCSAGKLVQVRKCIPPRSVSPSCVLGINELIQGEQYDSTCNLRDLKQIISCTHINSYANLRRDGGWSEWKPSSGCMYMPSLARYVRLESRACDNPTPVRDGLFCQGERTRQIDCGNSPLLGNRLVVLLSDSLDAAPGIRTALNAYLNTVRNKGAEVDLQVRNPALSVADLRNLIQGLMLPSGLRPNQVLLIGGFPHAKVDGKNASGQNSLIASDLPYEAPMDRYYAVSPGVYKMTPSAAGTPMSLQRAVFWIDFSTHSAVSSQYSNSAAKYLAFITKMAGNQAQSVHTVSILFKPKINLFVDGFWENQPFEVSSNVANLNAYVGTSRSTFGGFMELISSPADLLIMMAHSNSGVVSFGGKTYLPSNDSAPGQISSVSTDGSPSFFNGVNIKAKIVNFFDCYAGDPFAANNVVGSVLLNPQSTVVSAVASTTSGAMSNWNGWHYTNALSLGHTAANAFLAWSRDNYYDGGPMHFSKTPSGDLIQDLGNEWNTGLIKVGDPLYRPSQYSSGQSGASL